MLVEPRRMDHSTSEDAAAQTRDREWIERVRAGDGAAFEAMFRCYGDRLCGFVYGYLRSTVEAQELVQDLFLWIWQHRHEWEVAGTLQTYLFRSARNRALNHLRRRQIEQRFQERSLAQAPAEPIVGAPLESDARVRERELAAAIDRAVAELPERCRQVFLLNRQQGMSYAQIAEALGISQKTVEIHMGRALAALRRRLADWIR